MARLWSLCLSVSHKEFIHKRGYDKDLDEHGIEKVYEFQGDCHDADEDLERWTHICMFSGVYTLFCASE